jgi:hypothetical protein
VLQGYHLGASNIYIPPPVLSHPMILPFHLVAPPDLKFKSSFIPSIAYQILNILIPLRYKGVLHASETNHSYFTVSYN